MLFIIYNYCVLVTHFLLPDRYADFCNFSISYTLCCFPGYNCSLADLCISVSCHKFVLCNYILSRNQIPLASAVLGPESLIFVSIYNLIFNILIYTFGISVLEKASRQQALSTPTEAEDTLLISDADASTPTAGWKKLLNLGTISSLVTIILYLAPIHVPIIVSSTADYIGRSTTLLSMLVLGVSVAQLAPKDIFTHPKLYGFTILRQVLLPIGCILLMRPFITNTLIFNTMVLMLAVPAANMPLLLSKQLNLDTSTLSQAIILTTILSLITIPIVCLFL